LTVIGLRYVDKFYGGRAVLRGLDLSVAPGARIGLVGGNGAGKSTLLRLLAGLEEPDGGEVVRRRGLRVAFLPQYVECGVHTPMEVLRAARPELAEVRRDLEACEERLGEPEVTGDLRRMERGCSNATGASSSALPSSAATASTARRAGAWRSWASTGMM